MGHRCAPTRVRRYHERGIEGEHWFVEYYAHPPGLWVRLSIPLDTEEAALSAERVLRCDAPDTHDEWRRLNTEAE